MRIFKSFFFGALLFFFLVFVAKFVVLALLAAAILTLITLFVKRVGREIYESRYPGRYRSSYTTYLHHDVEPMWPKYEYQIEYMEDFRKIPVR